MAFCSWVKEEVYRDHFVPGLYVCRKCGHELFASSMKYKHDTPWPAFTNTIRRDSVQKRKENKLALKEGGWVTGLYVCVECGNDLFSSVTKYEHDSPWPAFTRTIHKHSVTKVPEEKRPNAVKVSCGKCGNGLGHEFLKDGPDGVSSRF